MIKLKRTQYLMFVVYLFITSGLDGKDQTFHWLTVIYISRLFFKKKLHDIRFGLPLHVPHQATLHSQFYLESN